MHMPSLESDIMRGYFLASEVIKDAVIADIQEAALTGAVPLTREQFAKVTQIVRAAVERAALNSAKQIQSSIAEHTKS
jgi:hypothetical protein